jgi:hypothetical protein
MPESTSLTLRNVATALLLALGIGLAAWASIDWIAYSGFVDSLLWK